MANVDPLGKTSGRRARPALADRCLPRAIDASVCQSQCLQFQLWFFLVVLLVLPVQLLHRRHFEPA